MTVFVNIARVFYFFYRTKSRVNFSKRCLSVSRVMVECYIDFFGVRGSPGAASTSII